MKIAVIGLGIIGSSAAANLRAAGHAVRVWSRTARPGEPGWAGSAADAAADVEMVHLFVRDGASLLAAVREMAPVLAKDALVVNSATVSLNDTREAAAMAEAAGARFLDCPFTGSRDAAAAGKLVYYVGGREEDIARARPLLEVTGREIIPVGEIGQATLVKLTTNMISATTVQILAEVLAILRAEGVPLETFARAMDANGSCSPLIRMKLPSIMKGDFSPHFSLENMLKDSNYACELAGRLGLALPVLSATNAALDSAAGQGQGALDYSVLARGEE